MWVEEKVPRRRIRPRPNPKTPRDIAGRRARSPPAFSLKGTPMTKDLYDKLMVFGNDREPFLTHNFMRIPTWMTAPPP